MSENMEISCFKYQLIIYIDQVNKVANLVIMSTIKTKSVINTYIRLAYSLMCIIVAFHLDAPVPLMDKCTHGSCTQSEGSDWWSSPVSGLQMWNRNAQPSNSACRHSSSFL